MPAATITVPGLLLLVQSMFEQMQGIGSTLLVDLIGSSVVSGDGSLPSDFVICSFPGYFQVPIAVATLVPEVVTSSFVQCVYVNNPISWGNAALVPITVYGYLVTSSSAGVVLWYQFFDSPRVVLAQNRVLLNLSLSIFPFINYTPPT